MRRHQPRQFAAVRGGGGRGRRLRPATRGCGLGGSGLRSRDVGCRLRQYLEAHQLRRRRGRLGGRQVARDHRVDLRLTQLLVRQHVPRLGGPRRRVGRRRPVRPDAERRRSCGAPVCPLRAGPLPGAGPAAAPCPASRTRVPPPAGGRHHSGDRTHAGRGPCGARWSAGPRMPAPRRPRGPALAPQKPQPGASAERAAPAAPHLRVAAPAAAAGPAVQATTTAARPTPPARPVLASPGPAPQAGHPATRLSPPEGLARVDRDHPRPGRMPHVDGAQSLGAGRAIHDVPRRLLAPLRIGELGLPHHVGQQVAVVEMANARATLHQLDEPGREQSVQRLADVELAHRRDVDDSGHVARAVEQGQDGLLLVGETVGGRAELVPGAMVDEVEGRDLLLDQAPLVHPPRTLEQQALGVERDEERLVRRQPVRREAERALLPGEQVVDRLLDLQPDEALELAAVDRPGVDEDAAELPLAAAPLLLDRRAELLLRDPAALDQHVAEPVEAVGDGGIADPADIEVDVALGLAVLQGETPALAPQRQQLEHVGDARLLDVALDRHWSASSTPAVNRSTRRSVHACIMAPRRAPRQPHRTNRAATHCRGSSRSSRSS